VKTLFYRADPVLFDAEKPFDAFLVHEGMITQTGTFEILKSQLAPGDDMVDLEGKPVIPGLTDCHLHLLAYAATKERNVNLKGLTSLEKIQDRVASFIREKKVKQNCWVSGSGWNHDLFHERKIPDRHDLDKISTAHPIKLLRMCYHICVVNTKALELAGIDSNTPDPEGGRIDKDAEGNPTGVLREKAMALLDEVIPQIKDKSEIKDLIISSCNDLIRNGFTTVHTDDFGFAGDRQTLLDAYLEFDEAGLLPLDIVLQMIIYEPDDLRFYLDNGLQTWTRFKRLSAGPVKILADGTLGSRTAALRTPYQDDPETSGFMLMSEQDLDLMIRQTFLNKFDVAVHAIGDLTMETVLNIYKKYRSLIEKYDLKPSVIHCQIASPSVLNKFKQLKIIANFQPVFLHSDWNIAEERVGKKRLKTSYCWKTFTDMGIPCVGSSDAPIESFNPFWNIYTAVARKNLDGMPLEGWIPEEALSREEALKLFTLYPPLLTGETDRKGQLKTGFTADFAVLSDHPYTVSENKIKNIQVLATYKEGHKVCGV